MLNGAQQTDIDRRLVARVKEKHSLTEEKLYY